MANKLIQLKPEFVKRTQSERLYECPWPVIGITGGIASGKSTACQILAALGVVVVSADHLVKLIYAKPESIEFVKKHFPDAVTDDKTLNKTIHFPTLRKLAFEHAGNRTLLENYLYPQMGWAFDLEFKRAQEHSRYQFIVYDVPLLFEKKLEAKMDLTVCVYTSLQRQREQLMKRDGIDQALAQKMIDGQMPLDQKLTLVDYVIRNEAGFTELEKQCQDFVGYVTLFS